MSERLHSDSAEAKHILQDQVRNLERSQALFLEARLYSGFSLPFRFLSAITLILGAGLLAIQANNLVGAAMGWLYSTGVDFTRRMWLERAMHASMYAAAFYLLVLAMRIALLLRSNAIYARGAADTKRRIEQLTKHVLGIDEISERIQRMVAAGNPVVLYRQMDTQVNDGAPKGLTEANVQEHSTPMDPLLKWTPALLAALLTICLWLGSPGLFLAPTMVTVTHRFDFIKFMKWSDYIVPVALTVLFLLRQRRGSRRRLGMFGFMFALMVLTAIGGVLLHIFVA